MACKDRRSTRDLIAEIGTEAPRFRFFQAVRLLALAARNADAPPVPASLRFGSPLSLSFPPSEILDARNRRLPSTDINADEQGIEEPPSSQALQLTVGFMGLTGPSGVLPTAYTEALIERRNFHRDTGAHAFLDIFTHRAVSLFYQAWRKHRFHIGYEAGERDRFARNILDLVGTGLNAVRTAVHPEDGVPDNLLSYFAGMLSQRPVSASSIAALLRGYFKVEVRIEQFVGQWINISEGEQSRIGAGFCVLGESAFVGERLWDRQNKLRLHIGPLDGKQFADFLPGCAGAAALRALMRHCVGHTLSCDVTLILRKECMPRAFLGKSSVTPLRLGYNTWLHDRPPAADPENACFSLLD